MPYYCFSCSRHPEEIAEISCSILQLHRMTPKCSWCGGVMERDYAAEGPKAFTNRSKGMAYTDTNLGQKPVEIESRQQLDRELKARGLRVKEPTSEERYRMKEKYNVKPK